MRCAKDVLKALALVAKAVFIGRPCIILCVNLHVHIM